MEKSFVGSSRYRIWKQTGAKDRADEKHLKDLHAKIGELALENDFYTKSLGR